MQNFTTDDLQHISKLANIPLSDEELGSLTLVFSQTIEYIKVLDELDTQQIAPTFQVNELKNVYQTPNSRTTLSQDEALENASDPIKGKFGTKAVFER